VHFEGTTEPSAIKRVETAITNWKADGLILDVTEQHIAEVIGKRGIPAIDTACKFETGLPVFSFDRRAAGRLAAQHFLERGHKNFGFWGGNVLGDRLQCEGFAGETARNGCRCACAGSGWTDWIRAQGRMEAWLKALPKPAAVMAATTIRPASRGPASACTWRCLTTWRWSARIMTNWSAGYAPRPYPA